MRAADSAPNLAVCQILHYTSGQDVIMLSLSFPSKS